MTFSASARSRLTRHDLDRFPGDGLFDRLGRAVCAAGCLPRKELYEAWEMGRRVRRRIRGGRLVDVAGGHGLLAHVLLLLDDTSPEAWVVDPMVPPSADTVGAALTRVWPRLATRVHRAPMPLDDFTLAPGDVVVSAHACGGLTDRVLDRAADAGARVAVLPCCHDLGGAHLLDSWVEGALAMDLHRAWRLEQRGYRVWTQSIPAEVTPKNRLLLGVPMS